MTQVYRSSKTVTGLYDGCDDAILRTSKLDVMLTHDLIEEFFVQFFKNRISISGWFKAKMSVLMAAAKALVDEAGIFPMPTPAHLMACAFLFRFST